MSVLSAALFSALLAAPPGAAEASRPDARLAERIESTWRVQQRWEGVARNGSFEYAFELKTWSASNRLKEQLERTARVVSRDGVGHTEVLSSRKDGRDDLAEAREEQRKVESKRTDSNRKSREFPSPFDPKYRGEYVFSAGEPGGNAGALSFQPRRRLEGAISGTVDFDAQGRPRKVAFGLAHPPMFTRHLSFTISLDEDGNPGRVDSSGEISLIVWKRRFESTLTIRNVEPGAARKGES